MRYVVKDEQILIDFLLQMTQKKRNHVKRLLKNKNVTVDGHIETYHAYSLKEGQVVEVSIQKQSLPFDILYEDRDMIVINKPCGLLSERTQKEKRKTAYQIVKDYLQRKHEHIYLVHRLDQYTSGVLMFVKSKTLYDILTHDWNYYVKVRGYQAIIEGRLKKEKGTIQNYLLESSSQVVYVSDTKRGKKAITHYEQLRTTGRYSLIRVRLDTGRKNQIRVHFSSIHHPIIGDKKYGAKTDPLKRLGLHANELVIVHPITHKEMKFVCDMPESFYKLLKKY